MSNQAQARNLAVVGVDAQDHSDEAVVAAFTLAPKLGFEVELVHATEVDNEVWLQIDPVGVQRAKDAAARRIEGALASAGLVGLDVTRSLRIAPGRATAVLLDAARERDASLIVLGAHRRSAPVDFGDTVRAVLAKATCPILVQHGAPRRIAKILCAIDIGPTGLEVLTLARDWARALGAELVTLHAFVRPQLGFLLGYPVQFPAAMVETARETEEREFRRMLEPFDWRGVLHRELFYEADPGTDVLSEQENYDLLVLGTHGRRELASVLVGSVASTVLRGAKRPVLVLRTV
jgi:nucleotide-binding universal stress UspA family protein